MIDVDYYKFEDGTNPIDPYLDGLDPKMRAKVLRAIGLLEEFGTALRMPHSEHLGDGIFELRVKQGSDIERVSLFLLYERQGYLNKWFHKETAENSSMGKIL